MANQVIIGNGISGTAAALTLLQKNPQSRVTVIAEEPFPPYARMILPDYIAGRIPEAALFPFNPSQWASMRLFLGKKVEEIRPLEQVVVLAGGEKIYFDHLLIASGASAHIPDVPGIRQKGVYPLRNLPDARTIRLYAQQGNRAVILGGGLVGLETTSALVTCGLKVEMIVASSRILSRVLDSRGAEIIEEHLKRKGVTIRKNTDASGIDSQGDKKIVFLNSGEKLICDLVIVAKGVEPNVPFIHPRTILQDQGIVANQRMETSIPSLYAAGDVAMAPGFFEGVPFYNAIWGEAIYQGIVAGKNMAGGQESYEGNLRANIFEVLGLKASAMGQGGRSEQENGVFSLEEAGSYKKLVFEKGKLVGALLIGEVGEAGVLQHLIRKRIDLGGVEEFYLRNRVSFGRLLPNGMFVTS